MSSSARIDELRQKFDENPRRYFAPLANEYRKVGDLDQAIFICQEYLPQQPGHMSGHIVYGQALFEARRHDEARAVFETALGLDPENLIALRHLGDIARTAGDVPNARLWYTRGLDADPRNVEMGALLASLPPLEVMSPATGDGNKDAVNGDAGQGMPSVADTPAPSPISWLDIEPSAHVEALPVEVLQVVEAPGPSGMKTPVLGPELIDLDEMAFAASAPTPVISHPAVPPSAQPVSTGTLGDLELTAFGEHAGSGAHSTAIAGLESHIHEQAPALDDDFLSPVSDDSSDFEPGLPAVEAVFTESIPESTPEPTPATAREPLIDAVESTPFLTETMAQLYLSQGHREEALSIYARLVEQRPDDTELRARYSAAESPPEEAEAVADVTAPEMSAGPSEEDPMDVGSMNEESAAVHAAISTGPTIREFLQQLFGGGSAVAAPASEPAAAPEPAVEPSSEQWPEMHAEPEAVADGAAEPTAGQVEHEPVIEHEPVSEMHLPNSMGVSEPVAPAADDGGSPIDALFEYAPSTEHDLAAAQLLADAFTPDGGDTDSLHGMPAHRASGELSLDSVFRSDAPVRRAETAAPSGFALDQFFSSAGAQSGAGPAPEASQAPSALPEDDVEQFNSWLTGLKKS